MDYETSPGAVIIAGNLLAKEWEYELKQLKIRTRTIFPRVCQDAITGLEDEAGLVMLSVMPAYLRMLGCQPKQQLDTLGYFLDKLRQEGSTNRQTPLIYAPEITVSAGDVALIQDLFAKYQNTHYCDRLSQDGITPIVKQVMSLK